MTARTDILDQPERLRGAFVSSLVLHLGMLGLFIGATFGHFFGGAIEHWGSPNPGFGSVAVNSVKTIPLYNRPAPPNPVSNDTASQVPQEVTKPKAKPQPKVKAPDPKAIPLPSRNAKVKPAETASVRNQYAEKNPPDPKRMTSSVGSAVSNPIYGQRGGGGVGVGTDSPFGTQFGWYADLLRQAVEQKWQTAGIDPRGGTTVTVQFTLLRNGALAPGSVRVVETSGNRALDLSAQRAVLDVGQFPAFPPLFTRERADLQLHFDLRR
jgi:periplasmic protein TonB